MSDYDPDVEAFQRKLARINAEYQRAIADVTQARAEGDPVAEDEAVDRALASRTEYKSAVRMGTGILGGPPPAAAAGTISGGKKLPARSPI